MAEDSAGATAMLAQTTQTADRNQAPQPASAVHPDPRLLGIPRASVFGPTALARGRAGGWERVDEQGEAVFTTSGRAAILLGLRVLGAGADDEVLVPTYHCPAMVEAVTKAGAMPAFYPIGADGGVDLEYLRRSDTSKVMALLAAHFFGLPQRLDRVRAFCDERNIALIEDCAHAYFGYSALGPVGSIGDIAIGSLPKFFPVTEGGCLVSRRPGLRLPLLSSQGVRRELQVAWDTLELGCTAGRLGSWGRPAEALMRVKQRLRGGARDPAAALQAEPDLAAACNTVDLCQAERRATRTAAYVAQHADVRRIADVRRANYRRFAAHFEGGGRLKPLAPELPEGAVPYVFPLEVDDPQPLYRAIRGLGVPLYRWDLIWPGTPQLPGDSGPGWSRRIFQLACHQDMAQDDVDAVARAVLREASKGHP